MEQESSHWDRYKKYYLLGGVVALASLSAFAGYKVGSKNSASGNINGLLNINADPIQNNITVALVRRGHPGNQILCNQTGEVFASQMRAAKANGISPSSLSEHLRGLKDDVNGLTFENLGEMV